MEWRSSAAPAPGSAGKWPWRSAGAGILWPCSVGERSLSNLPSISSAERERPTPATFAIRKRSRESRLLSSNVSVPRKSWCRRRARRWWLRWRAPRRSFRGRCGHQPHRSVHPGAGAPCRRCAATAAAGCFRSCRWRRGAAFQLVGLLRQQMGIWPGWWRRCARSWPAPAYVSPALYPGATDRRSGTAARRLGSGSIMIPATEVARGLAYALDADDAASVEEMHWNPAGGADRGASCEPVRCRARLTLTGRPARILPALRGHNNH